MDADSSAGSSHATLIDAVATSPDEALAVLTAEAERHAIGLPGAVLAAQALRVTAGTDFAVARDALDALVRRAMAARRDQLIVVARPRGTAARGRYRVARRVWSHRVE